MSGSVYQQITIAVSRTAAGFLNQTEGFESFMGNGGIPHVSSGNPVQQFQLASAVINGQGIVGNAMGILLDSFKGKIRKRTVSKGDQCIWF